MKSLCILGLVLGILALAIILVLAAGTVYFFHQAVQRSPKAFLDASEDLAVKRQPSQAFSDQWLMAQRPEEAWIEARDGIRLHAWYLPAPRSSSGQAGAGQARPKAVILAHGYSSEGRYMGGFARFYSEVLGYAVLLPDARAHGQSGGRYIGFGWLERLDYLGWISWLEKRTGPGLGIVLHGVSMGGATVMMAAGEALPPSVKAVVEDCGYTSVEEELSWQMGRLYHLPAWPLVPLTSALTKVLAGYSFREASALDQVRKAKLPILFIHGEADEFVPFSMQFRLYEACPDPKEILVIPGAGHGLAYDTDPEAYEARVRLFAEKYLN